MITREVAITLPGQPAPKGSLKCVGKVGTRNHQLVEDVRVGQKPWREKIATTVAHMVEAIADPGEPVGVEVTFSLDRPAAHYGSGRNRTRLNASAPELPTGHNTNDVDKMLRLVLDALEDSGLLNDDAQVVEVLARKTYLSPSREALTRPSPGESPPWAERFTPVPDALGYTGALIRVYPVGVR